MSERTKITWLSLAGASGVAAGLAVLPAQAASWPDLPAAPLLLQAMADPNIVVTLDDSGSMARAFVPDGVGPHSRRIQAAKFNRLAYNPFLVYQLPFDPSKKDGSPLKTSFSKAWRNGFNSDTGGSVNLGTKYRMTYTYNPENGSESFNNDPDSSKDSPAYFYAFYNDLGPGGVVPTPGTDPATFARNTSKPIGCGGITDTNNEACYIRVSVDAAHQQNFANWYSFYRTRNLLVVSAANIAFYSLNSRFRVTWQALNTCRSGFFRTDCAGWDGAKLNNDLRPFTGGHKDNFYTWLHRLPAEHGTPLRSAMIRAGDFFKLTGVKSSVAADPGVTLEPISACRPNFHVMMTDGIWNSDNPIVGNVDGGATGLPDGNSYPATAPYTDSNSNSLADLAFRYWSTDLQPGLNDGMVPFYPVKTGAAGAVAPADYWNPRNDPAKWQHMVNFTIGLGLSSWLSSSHPPEWGGSTYTGDYPKLVSGATSWPATGPDKPGNVADLWHAALNSRGQFFSAESSQDVLNAFKEILTRITAQSTSAGQGAASSRRVGGGTMTYSTNMMPGEWYSTLRGAKLYLDGSQGPTVWDTDTTLKNESGRKLFTSVGGVGKPFAWGSFSASQRTDYFNNDIDLFKWLTGVREKEGAPFRVRKQLLGDIIRSDMAASSKSDFGYAAIPGIGLTYAAHVNAKQPVVFVGANDGMVHAFDGNTGAEKFAYFPEAVHSKLKALADPIYVHQDLVDGPLALFDAYVGGWKTFLIGGLGAGGRSIFVLDVTSTIKGGSFSESDVVMEIQDEDLGHNFQAPTIGRLRNGDWVALVGNGYGAKSKRAILFVINLTSKTVTKIDTGVGSDAAPNGLAAPVAIEYSPGNIRGIYAGDYRGNLWRFDAAATGAISVGLGGVPLFIAKDDGGKLQPITSAPRVVEHPSGGLMVLFGTGKFFETEDRSSRTVQTFYAVRDFDGPVGGRPSLVQQTMVAGGGSVESTTVRALSGNAVDYPTKKGWFIDFSSKLAGGPSGERIVAPAYISGNEVMFNTFIPNIDPCQGVGQSFLMVTGIYTGTLPEPVLDTNGDGKFDSMDMAGGRPASGKKYAGDGTLFSPYSMLVGDSRGRGSGGSNAGTPCGDIGQAPCVSGPPCVGNLVVNASGTCSLPVCKGGSEMTSQGSCKRRTDLGYQRWAELK